MITDYNTNLLDNHANDVAGTYFSNTSWFIYLSNQQFCYRFWWRIHVIDTTRLLARTTPFHPWHISYRFT